MTVVAGEYRDSPRRAGGSPASRALDLTEEHGHLLRQVAVRAGELMAAVRGDRWPTGELKALLGYLRAEIIRQTVDQETLLFPARGDAPRLGRLARDHARLRAGVEVLELMAQDGGGSLATLATTVRDLLSQLESHLAAEEAVLGTGCGSRSDMPATTALGAHPHEWYPLTRTRVGPLRLRLPGRRPRSLAGAGHQARAGVNGRAIPPSAAG